MVRKLFRKFIGAVFILIGAFCLFLKSMRELKKIELESIAMEEYYEEYYDSKKIQNNDKIANRMINYIGVLEIPKLNLKRGLVSIDSELNDVDKNIEIVSDDSSLENKNNIVLAAHSGNSNVSYFRELDKLIIGDTVILDYEGQVYKFLVNEITTINKTGYVSIRDNLVKTLYLITCKRDSLEQIVVSCILDWE